MGVVVSKGVAVGDGAELSLEFCKAKLYKTSIGIRVAKTTTRIKRAPIVLVIARFDDKSVGQIPHSAFLCSKHLSFC